MVPWGWLIFASVLGGSFGFVLAAICNAAKDDKKED